MTNTNFEGAEASNSGDFNTTNDFRQYQLLKITIQVVQSGATSAGVLKQYYFLVLRVLLQ